MKKSDSYSRDDNLWHISHEGLDLEDPWNEPKLDSGMLKMTTAPSKAPDEPEYVSLDFEKGVPVAIDGKKLDGVSLIKALNVIAGRHGCGILDMVENRVVGMKSRGVYETPGGSVIMEAHAKLEQICLDRKTLAFKVQVGQRFADTMYEGEWFCPLREALCAFIDSTQRESLRHGQAQALEGVDRERRDEVSLLALRRQPRELHYGTAFLAQGFGRLHQSFRPAHQGARKARSEDQGRRRRPPSRRQTRRRRLYSDRGRLIWRSYGTLPRRARVSVPPEGSIPR